MADCYQLHGHLTRPRLVPTRRRKYHYERMRFHRLQGTALHLGTKPDRSPVLVNLVFGEAPLKKCPHLRLDGGQNLTKFVHFIRFNKSFDFVSPDVSAKTEGYNKRDLIKSVFA